MNSFADLLRDMIDAAPELEFVRRQHLTDNGELLPHVLFGDVTRWIIANHPRPRLLTVLEHYLSTGSDEVQAILTVSFLENLEKGKPADDQVRRALPPQLRAKLMSIEAWSPPPGFDPYANLALSVERRTIKVIRDDQDHRRVEIFRRGNGTYGFAELRRDNVESAWIQIGRYVESVTDSAERAESEARSRVAWLTKGSVSDP